MLPFRQFFALVALAGVPFVVAKEAPTAVMPEAHFDFLNNYCMDCHDTVTEEGSVNLEELAFSMDSVETAELWQKVLNVLNSGEMPPEDEPQPENAEKTQFLDDLSNQLVVARKILSDAGGVITMRRLNRREYENTIEDLLGVAIHAEELPKDMSPGSFDTVGASLFFSSDQFEQYFTIAKRALTTALIEKKNGAPKKKRQQSEIAANKLINNRYNRLLDHKQRADQWSAAQHLPPTDFGFVDGDRAQFWQGRYKQQAPGYQHYLSLPESQEGAVFFATWDGFLIDAITLPKSSPPGRYLIRARVGGFGDAPSKRHFLEIGTVESSARPGELTVLDSRKVNASYENPEVVEFEITVTPSSSRKIAIRERVHNTREAARFAFREAARMDLPMLEPALWVDWLEWEGPIEEPNEAPFWKWALGGKSKVSQTDGYVRDIIERFAIRAFRSTKPTEAFVDKLFALYQNRRASGATFEKALIEPLAAILASPGFLYLSEPNEREETRELDEMELAVRLSYFLWSGPPDEELYQAARKGKLKKSAELRRQTNRMLADPKAWEFYSGFTEQWLHMDRLDFFQFNFQKYPEFDDSGKSSARNEIFHTLKVLVDEGLSIENLLKSDFVVVNDLLAEYYGIEGVAGSHFRKVPVPSDSPRGGLLGTAAVLAMGSDGERSSPVERGAWVLRKLLNDPPPPAPANVPQLSRLSDEMLSARDLLQAHMEEPQCAQCHRKIDPIGFGLENFDAAGKWRTQEEIEATKKGKKNAFAPIDPSGILPDKTPFKNYFEMRERIAEHGDAFARGLTEALIAYGLGRPYGFTDYDLAEEILNQAKKKDMQASAYIHALIQSEAFRQK